MPKFIVMDEPNANLDDVGEGALVNAIGYLKSQGCAVIITTHRPRLVGAADNLLVLRNGTQVGFGPAEEMINAVRNLKLVDPAKPPSSSEPVDGVSTLKEGTSDSQVPSSGPSSSPP
jgi:ABC-type protease/lipase transport system fused ATPase/permease subunit